MPNYNFGMGLQSNPMDAYNEMSGMVKQSRLAKLLGGYYQNGQADLGQIAQLDPQAAQAIQKEQQQRGIAKLLGDAYAAPEEQRGGMLRQLIAQDPSIGMQAAKMLDPRLQRDNMPSGWQQFDLTAQAAGYKPGTPEYERAARIALGVDPRAVTGAMKFGTFEDDQGRARPQRNNPTTGQSEIFQAETGQWVPLGAGMPQAAPEPPQGGAVEWSEAAPPQSNGFRIDPTLPPQIQAQIKARETAVGNRPWTANTPNPYGNAAPAPAGIGVGMSATGKAYATESGQQQAQIDALRRRGELEAMNAGDKETATVLARMEAERTGKQANAKLDSTETITLLGGAEKLLQRASGGMLQAGRDKLLGAFNQTTEGSRATAGLKIIAAKLIQKVPRFEGPQSNIDVQSYREAAGDLANDSLPVGQRLAALETMRQLAQKAAGQTGGGQAPRVRRYNAQTGKLE